jgi:hypothetical protein
MRMLAEGRVGRMSSLKSHANANYFQWISEEYRNHACKEWISG